MTKSSSDSRPVRLGIVGLGAFGRLHALTASGLAEAQTVALVDLEETALNDISDRLPGAGCWTVLDQALEESETEAWVVATSTDSHVRLTKTLLEAGKPVLLEKPIAEDFSKAQSLRSLVNPDSSNLMLGHLLLFNSEFCQLLKEVACRGPIDFIDCVRHRPAVTLDRYPGETPFHLTMVHDLYMVQVLKNRADPLQLNSQVHQTADGACDLALAQLQWGDGTMASLTASFMTPPGMPIDGFDRMEVFGRGWSARIQANPRPFEIWDDRAGWPIGLEIQSEKNSTTGMLAEQLRCFCRVVRGLQSVPVGATYEDALQVQRWLEQLVGR